MAVGAVRLPVHLTVGETTAEVGTLVLHVVPRGEQSTDIRTELAALLRGVADHLSAEGVPGAAAHH